MDKILPTRQVGSLAKPIWRVKGYRGEPLSKEGIAEAVIWGRRLGIEDLDLLGRLLGQGDSAERRRAILEWPARYAIRFFDAAGFDVV